MEERWHSPEIGDQTGVETKTGMKKIMDLLKKKRLSVILETVAFNILVKKMNTEIQNWNRKLPE